MDTGFRTRWFGIVDVYGCVYDMGSVPYPTRRVALAPPTPANQQSSSGDEVPTPCVAVSTRWDADLFPSWVGVVHCMEGSIVRG